jgi:hypothetical protein
MSTFLKSVQIENISLPSLFANPVRKGEIVEVRSDDVATTLLTRSHWEAKEEGGVPVELFHWEKSTAKEYKAQEDAKAEAVAGQRPNVRTEPVKDDTNEQSNEPEGTHPPKAAAAEQDEEHEEEEEDPVDPPAGGESGDIRMTDLSEDGAGKNTETTAPKAPATPKAPKAVTKPAAAKAPAKAPARRAAPVQRKK